MNVVKPMPVLEDARDRARAVPIDRDVALPPEIREIGKKSRFGRRIFAAAAGLLLLGGLAIGVWQHLKLNADVEATASQRRDFVPSLRVAAVRSSGANVAVSLPGTTEAFEQANIYSRTSGYVGKRYVDIADRVKAGALLAEITAPELDHQISQAQATLVQNQASLRQVQANKELAEVTWGRDSSLLNQGWITKQQGDQERLALAAQQAAVAVAQANIQAQDA